MKTLASILISLVFFGIQPALADSVDDLLEQARSKGKGFEKLKKVLNEEPDQNVRLATFDLVMKGEDETMKAIAIDAGLASADRLLQAAAFKAAIMDLERIHLKLELVEGTKSEMPKSTKKYLANEGYEFVISLKKKNTKSSTFTDSNQQGEIAGTRITYVNRYYDTNGTFQLKDDDAIEGALTMYGVKFKATAKIR